MNAVIHHASCIDMVGKLDAGSVDCIFTDPPYPREYLPCYVELAALAVHALKPGGQLLAMSGHAHLPDILALMDVPGLTYRWCISYTYECPRAMIHSAQVSVGWKPVLVYTRDGEPMLRDGYAADMFRIPPKRGRDKRDHVWGQNFYGVYQVADEWLRRGWTVCDPFVGAGSLLLAAKRRGCTVIGCDVDEVHVENAKDLLRDDLVDQAQNLAAG